MEEAIIAKLLADSGVAGLTGARVFPGSRPQGSALPAAVLNRISGGPLYADDGEVGLVQARIQIDCWAATYSAAKTRASGHDVFVRLQRHGRHDDIRIH
jgi:hypothetical protein